MKNVMTRAWEIAKEGAAKFGGKAVEYFAEALRMAWAEIKKSTKAVVALAEGTRNNKTWLAEITGTHSKYKFNRQFVNGGTQSEDSYEIYYQVEEGKIYESNNFVRARVLTRNDGSTFTVEDNVRAFFQIVNGSAVELDEDEVLAAI